VFSTLSGVAVGLPNVGIGMNVNNHPTSANLGVFVVLGIVPIIVYVVVILVLPWVGRGFH
jgi:hypothetical protein